MSLDDFLPNQIELITYYQKMVYDLIEREFSNYMVVKAYNTLLENNIGSNNVLDTLEKHMCSYLTTNEEKQKNI